MEIIKRGKANKSEVWRCKCPLCETEVKILKGDPDILKYHNCSGSFREEVKWICPVCETEVVSATAEHHGSATENLISCKEEVITAEEKELIMSWGCVDNLDDEHPWYKGIWNRNN